MTGRHHAAKVNQPGNRVSVLLRAFLGDAREQLAHALLVHDAEAVPVPSRDDLFHEQFTWGSYPHPRSICQ